MEELNACRRPVATSYRCAVHISVNLTVISIIIWSKKDNILVNYIHDPVEDACIENENYRGIESSS